MSQIAELRQVTVCYKGTERLKELNLKIAAGRIVGIIGGPGSGKTTLLAVVSGLIQPAAGQVTLSGGDIDGVPAAEPLRVGYVPASLGLDEELTVAETLLIFPLFYQERKQSQAPPLNMLELTGLEFYADITVGRLSKSQKLLLATGISLLQHPQLLLIDEPAPYLETSGRLEFLSLLARITRRGTAVVIATASTEQASCCDEIAFLHKGRLSLVGTVEALGRAYDVTCFETVLDGRISDDMVQLLGNTGTVSYVSGRMIRVVNPPGGGGELVKYGFYQTKPGIEDVKRLYESVASL